MSVATAHVEIVAPIVPGAAPGTVVGAAEVLDRANRRLARVPLRAERPTRVEVPPGERCRVHGWSPYLSVQSIEVTGGRTEKAVLTARRASGEGTGGEQSRRGATGWVRLWGREPDGHWTVQDPSGMATGGTAAVATPLGGPTVLQVGGGHQRPVCTLVPAGSLFMLQPAAGRSQRPVEIRSAADSGFTLLEALRLGEWGWAAVMERVWWDDPSVRGTPLFDLAVAYHACRRGDLDQVGRWRAEAEHRPESDPAWIDVLAVDAWLARRQGEWRDLAEILDRLADYGRAPLAAEGLDLLAADLIRPAPQSGPEERLRRLLTPYLRASLPSSLTSFTAAHPQKPMHRPPQGAPPGRPLPFRVEKNTNALRIQWRVLRHEPTEGEEYAVAAHSLPPDKPGLRVSAPEGRNEWLIVEHEDPMVLWWLSHRLLEEGVTAGISLVPGRNAVAVALPERGVGPLAVLLPSLLREGRVRRLGLSVRGRRLQLDVEDAAAVQLLLASLLG
ncbi:hypothetical protein ACIP39_11460 [Streptomyces tibetensis]|uniref:hypothetical protein n=1 Tax=Streptomyces tibetensis TaxID=2382123 RepID=UPI0038184F96